MNRQHQFQFTRITLVNLISLQYLAKISLKSLKNNEILSYRELFKLTSLYLYLTSYVLIDYDKLCFHFLICKNHKVFLMVTILIYVEDWCGKENLQINPYKSVLLPLTFKRNLTGLKSLTHCPGPTFVHRSWW